MRHLNYKQLNRIGTWILNTLVAMMVLGAVGYVALLGLNFAGDSVPFLHHHP